MSESVTIRVEKPLMERVDLYAKTNEIKGEDAPKIDAELQQMILEIFIRENQQYLFSVENISVDKSEENFDKVRFKIKERFPLISKKYKQILFPNG